MYWQSTCDRHVPAGKSASDVWKQEVFQKLWVPHLHGGKEFQQGSFPLM